MKKDKIQFDTVLSKALKISNQALGDEVEGRSISKARPT